jgi:hypothetical protein
MMGRSTTSQIASGRSRAGSARIVLGGVLGLAGAATERKDGEGRDFHGIFSWDFYGLPSGDVKIAIENGHL